MMIDEAARYLKTHEWIKPDGDGYAIGLTAYAIEQLGDIVYMELPEVGKELAQGDVFGIVESVKSASDLYMPIGGTVTQVHQEVPDSPDIIKADAYGQGWLIKIEASDAGQLDALMDAAAYRAFLETEA